MGRAASDFTPHDSYFVPRAMTPRFGARCVTAMLVMLAVGAASAHGQVDALFRVGFASSVFRMGEYLPSGVAVDGGLSWRPGHGPVSLRLQVSYARLRANPYSLGEAADGADLWAALLLAALDIPVRAGARLRPYVVGGGGLQHRGSIGNLGLEYSRPTLTGGVGVDYRLGMLTLNGEWRFGVVGTNAGRETVMPVMVGVRLPTSAPAGESAPKPGIRSSARRGTVASWFAYAPTTWSSPPVGGTPDRGLVLAALRCTWPLAGDRGWRLDYTADLFPAALMTRTVLPSSGAPTGQLASGPRGAVYGIGIAPLGVIGGRQLVGDWWLTLGAATGMLGFSHDVPLPGARKINFLLDAAVGMEGGITPGLRLLGGVRLDHVSNANSGYYNPGANFIAFYIGVARGR